LSSVLHSIAGDKLAELPDTFFDLFHFNVKHHRRIEVECLAIPAPLQSNLIFGILEIGTVASSQYKHLFDHDSVPGCVKAASFRFWLSPAFLFSICINHDSESNGVINWK
jgi:hypothetical protein